MTRVKLSKRLQRLADFVPVGSRIADIGSDHGLLVSHLVLEGIAGMAVAGEVKPGPFNSTKRQVEEFNLKDQIKVRLGDGLAVIEEPVDIVIIAGMGGTLMAAILENGKDKLQSVQRLILQPNTGEIFVRKWLYANQWKIIDEEIIKEKKHYYEIIIAEKSDRSNRALSNTEYRVGPINLLKKSLPLLEKWELELKKQEKVIKKLKNLPFSIKKLQLLRAATKEYSGIKQIIGRIGS